MQQIQELEITHLPIGDLRPDPANPRRISDEELESLTRSIREFWAHRPHHRPEGGQGGNRRPPAPACSQEARTEASACGPGGPTRGASSSVEPGPQQISGSWDQELLARLLGELKDLPDVDITLTGFSEDELQKHLKSLESREKRERLETFDLDEAMEAARTPPVARTGDLWLLGDHRLLCGDSIDSGDVGRLMNGRKLH